MADFGGQIRFTYNGTGIVIRGKVEMEPTDFSYTGEHNQNGTFDRYMQPMGPMADIEFSDSIDGASSTSQPWNAIMGGGPYNIAIIEDTTAISHTFSNAKFVGRPKIDRLKGLVTGIQIQCAVGAYKQLSA